MMVMRLLILAHVMGRLLLLATHSTDTNYVQDRVSMLLDRAEAVSPSVVRIVSLGQGERNTAALRGAGFVVGADGLIATAAHVLEGVPAGAIRVVPADTEPATYDHATVTIVSIDQKHDIALLRSAAVENRTPLALASADDVSFGQEVLMLGCPTGEQDLTIHRGKIAVKTSRIVTASCYSEPCLKLDADVNRGSNGGPVISLTTGKVIGLASSAADGMVNRGGTLFGSKLSASLFSTAVDIFGDGDRATRSGHVVAGACLVAALNSCK